MQPRQPNKSRTLGYLMGGQKFRFVDKNDGDESYVVVNKDDHPYLGSMPVMYVSLDGGEPYWAYGTEIVEQLDEELTTP